MNLIWLNQRYVSIPYVEAYVQQGTVESFDVKDMYANSKSNIWNFNVVLTRDECLFNMHLYVIIILFHCIKIVK